MHPELQVLKLVSERLEAAHIPFMLTGSFAMAYYGQPRMTRDIDLVVALKGEDVPDLVAALSSEFYIDADDAHLAVESQRLFNLMHHATGIKVDLQRRDVESLLDESVDRKYLDHWAMRLGVTNLLREISA